MIVLDRLLIGGIRFVLDKVVTAVDAEMNDDGRVREDLLAAQMQLELGEIGEEEFAALERDLLDRLRRIKERQRGESEAHDTSGPEFKVTGIEATFEEGHEVDRK